MRMVSGAILILAAAVLFAAQWLGKVMRDSAVIGSPDAGYITLANRDSRHRWRGGPHYWIRGKTSASPVEAAPKVPAGRVPRIARLMALALRFEQLLCEGEIRNYAELARLGHVSRARVSQIMRLLSLAPTIQEALFVLAANCVRPRSHSPAAAPVRGRRIGMATTALSLEGAPGNDAGYDIASLGLTD